MLGRNRRGFEAYARGLLKRLHEVAPDDEFVLYIDHPVDDDILARSNYRAKVIPSGAHSLLWTNRALPRIAREDGIDVFHFPSSNTWFASGVKTVVTLHDISFMLRNEVAFMPFYTKAYTRLLLWRMRDKADLLITDSEASRRDICAYMEVQESRVRVVHLGVDERFRPLDKEGLKSQLVGIGVGSRPYLLYVGGLDARKNLKTLVKAFDIFRDETNYNPLLVVVGEARKAMGNIATKPDSIVAGARNREDILFLGYASDEDLVSLYNGAMLLIIPSLYEAFGLTAVEAMACGTPVIGSNNAAIPEVGGDAALYFSPNEPEQMAHCMARVLSEPELAQRMRLRGLERARLFSWKEKARQTLQCYRECAGL
ncbi:MAG TPA: glycosyltransferase family 1 protein [Candidatus Brocadiia bacterium]|nr:glycosyltransferase family 1 protein [Candidatus Brocadiia bacterium]